MRNSTGKLLRIVLLSVGVIVVLAASVVVYLIYPGTPGSAASLSFQGYIPLPSDTPLSVLDYLTVDGARLCVTGESSGVPYRIQLSSNSLPTVADVSKLAGQPAT